MTRAGVGLTVQGCRTVSHPHPQLPLVQQLGHSGFKGAGAGARCRHLGQKLRVTQTEPNPFGNWAPAGATLPFSFGVTLERLGPPPGSGEAPSSARDRAQGLLPAKPVLRCPSNSLSLASFIVFPDATATSFSHLLPLGQSLTPHTVP